MACTPSHSSSLTAVAWWRCQVAAEFRLPESVGLKCLREAERWVGVERCPSLTLSDHGLCTPPPSPPQPTAALGRLLPSVAALAAPGLSQPLIPPRSRRLFSLRTARPSSGNPLQGHPHMTLLAIACYCGWLTVPCTNKPHISPISSCRDSLRCCCAWQCAGAVAVPALQPLCRRVGANGRRGSGACCAAASPPR